MGVSVTVTERKLAMISVIVPVYNVEKYLPRCIESILGQTYTDIELILIDDGSADKSGAICDMFASKDKRILVIHKANGGVSSARNEGLKKCSGKYVSFVDADDWIEPNMFEKILCFLEESGSDFAVFNEKRVYLDGDKVAHIEERNNWKALSNGTVLYGKDIFYKIFSKSGVLWNKIFKRDVLVDVFFHENLVYGEDTVYLLEALIKCQSAVVVVDNYYNYAINRVGNVVSGDLNEKCLDLLNNNIYIYHKIKSTFPEVGVKRIKVAITQVIKKIEESSANINVKRQYIQKCKEAACAVDREDCISYYKSDLDSCGGKMEFIICRHNPNLIVHFKSILNLCRKKQ